MMELALPFEPNALRPPAPLPAEPEEYSLPQAAKMLGITERQLRYKIEHEKIPGVEKLGRRIRILPAGLEHLRRQVRDPARRQQEKTRRAMLTEKARVYGMKPDAIRQMIRRGPRTLEGTPDWDALEVQLKRKAAAQGGDGQYPSLSEDEIRKLIAYRDSCIARAKTKQEYDTFVEQRLLLQQRRGGSHL
jgi:hypothetical protein